MRSKNFTREHYQERETKPTHPRRFHWRFEGLRAKL